MTKREGANLRINSYGLGCCTVFMHNFFNNLAMIEYYTFNESSYPPLFTGMNRCISVCKV